MLTLALMMVYLTPEPDPPLSDLAMFPETYEQSMHCWHFSCRHEKWLGSRVPLGTLEAEVLEEWKLDAVFHCQLWSDLADAQDTRFSVDKRRGYLRQVKERLGDDLYYQGWMPPPAPIGYFRVD